MKIAVLYGGNSSERDVSLNTGKAVITGLKNAGFEVKAFEINESDIVHYLDELRSFDIVFLGYHGGFGESGKVQALLEMQNIRFTGPNSLSSAVAMNKVFTKIILNHNNIPTPKWISLNNESYNFEQLVNDVKELKYPLAIKPASEGSSIGFSKVNSEDQLDKACKLAFNYDFEILIEEFIAGKELSVPILINKALPPVLIQPIDGYYDYEHKYTSGKTEYFCPAPIPQDIIKTMQEYALKAYELIGCSNYSRIDFRLRENELFCLEINTLPGMTSLSLVPMAAKTADISFEELLTKIVNDAYSI